MSKLFSSCHQVRCRWMTQTYNDEQPSAFSRPTDQERGTLPLLTMAILWSSIFLARALLLPSRTEITSLAKRSSKVFPGLLSLASRIHFTANFVLCFSPKATGFMTFFEPCRWDKHLTAGEAAKIASRKSGNGSLRVKE